LGRNLFNRHIRAAWIAAPLILFAALLTACDPGRSALVENETSSYVIVYRGDVPGDVLAPGASVRFSYIEFDGSKSISVRPINGTDLGPGIATREFSWSDLDKGGVKIVLQ
jgi:hypothetical protein